MLEYIANDADIIIHFNALRVIPSLCDDSHYRSQFETGTSSGLVSRTARQKWEARLFNNFYDAVDDCERVKYGVLNLLGCECGVGSAKGYGRSYFVLKQHMRERVTVTAQDSCSASPVGTLRHLCHVCMRWPLRELQDCMRIALGSHIARNGITSPGSYQYKECQIHSPVLLTGDIARLVVHPRDVKHPVVCCSSSKRRRRVYEIAHRSFRAS